MPLVGLVLVIESDAAQADTLRQLLRARANIDVVIVASKDAAVAAVDERVPDLVLIGALMSPRDEDAFIVHLRTLPDAGHLQTLTIPHLRQTHRRARGVLSMFDRRAKRPTDAAAGGCDPMQFGSEVAAYLSRACDVKAEITQKRDAALALERHRASTLELEQDAARAVGEGELQLTERTRAAELDRSRVDTDEAVVSQPPAAERRPADPATGEINASDMNGVEASHAEATAQAGDDKTLAAALDRVRADAEQVLATELASAEERRRIDVARLEAEAAKRADAAAREAQAAKALAVELDRVRAEADRTLALQLTEAEERVRADAEQVLATELASAEERRRIDVARLEAEAAKRADAVAREAQAAEALAVELDRVGAEADRTLALQLAEAEERRRADIARLETEAAEKAEVAARAAQEAAETEAAWALATELDLMRAEADRTLAAELAAAEQRHRVEIDRVEADAGMRQAAASQAQATAEARADETLAAERERVRTDAERTLANELTVARERHYADLARLEVEAAARNDAATREARVVAEALAAETLAAEREHARAGAEQALASELDRMRADAARTLSAELAAAEERGRAEVLRVRDSQDALAEKLEHVQIQADRAEAEAARLAAQWQEAADRERVRSTAPSTALSAPASLEPVHRDAEASADVTNYYDLWKARFAGEDVPPAAAVEASLSRLGRRRRRWVLAAAAVLVTLLVNSLGSDLAVRPAMAAGASGVSRTLGSVSVLEEAGGLAVPLTEPSIDNHLDNGVGSVPSPGQIAVEVVGVLLVLLLLRITLGVGEGLVWRGLVVSLGIVLLGFVMMRAPWPADSAGGPGSVTSSRRR